MVFRSNKLFFRFQMSDIDFIPSFSLIYSVRGNQTIWKTSMAFSYYIKTLLCTQVFLLF